MQPNKLLQKFLEFATCPNCEEQLLETVTGMNCLSCNTTFCYNNEGILLFCPRTEEVKKQDKYEDEKYIERYAGVFAFGYKTLGRGQMESLHRTVSELVLSSGIKEYPYYILDVGCGVGRATFNCASNFDGALVVGIDLSETVLKMAKKIVIDKETFSMDLSAFGFEKGTMQGFGLENVVLVQGNANLLPFKQSTFDLVVNVNLIDRVTNPEKTLKSIISVLRPGGRFIFTSPLNWANSDLWNKYHDKDTIRRLFTHLNLKIEEFFDGLIYREAHDTRSYSDWCTFVISAKKET